MPCKMERYEIISQLRLDAESNNNLAESEIRHVVIKMDGNVKSFDSSVSYGLSGLIGEIGGTIGVFLGWSIWSVIQAGLEILQPKRKAKIFLTNIFGGILLLSFAYWSLEAFDIFANEKETMEFQSKPNLKRPWITVCPFNWLSYEYPECGSTEKFIDGVRNCLAQNQSLVVDDILKKNLEVMPLIGPIKVISGRDEDKPVTFNQNIFKTVFHRDHGTCYSMDSKFWNKDHKNIEFHFYPMGIPYHIQLHNIDDFSKSQFIQPDVKYGAVHGFTAQVEVKNRFFSKSSTKSKPCGQTWKEVCDEKSLHQSIKDEFGCQIPILYTGKHLDSFQHLPQCSAETMLTVLSTKVSVF